MRTLMRGLGELAATAGLVLVLGVAYLVWGTGDHTRRQQAGLADELERRWQARHLTATPSRRGGGGNVTETAPPAPGGAFTLLRIPRLGARYRYVVVEGVSPADLRKGPGHYPGTARPGEVGNMVVSGHRTTYGAPFRRVDELVRGDEIHVGTAAGTHVYRVTGRRVVRPDAMEVILPVPGRPGRAPRRRLLTLTTCHPEFSAAYRLVVSAEHAGFRAGRGAA
ncbi:sortase A [Actinomadura namibiensis]|uniref:Sortase A n=2 Tax=Actinomadura TaxID=1988 RepID=A0A7W3LZ51_ACTNM|nr:class E sortase [Actinomadura namibiensis]MBA8956865.1 sortase A [Actinomadura namibiensis]